MKQNATDQFKMRISPQDKAILRALAKRFQRTQADTIKFVVRELYDLLKKESKSEKEIEG